MILGPHRAVAGLKGDWSRGLEKDPVSRRASEPLSLAAGLPLDRYGICPSVKRIWTPSWSCLSGGGWCLFLYGGLLRSRRLPPRLRPLFLPLIVIGMNSIAIYVLVHINLHEFIILQSFRNSFYESSFFNRAPRRSIGSSSVAGRAVALSGRLADSLLDVPQYSRENLA